MDPVLLAYSKEVQQLKNIHCIDSRKQRESMNTDTNVITNQNSIINIDLNIGKYISEINYGAVSTTDINV